MKTIRTLAGEIGVTKQAIFQKMKKEPLATALNELTTKVGGIVYVYPEGEGMIKEQFHKMQPMQPVFTIGHVESDGAGGNMFKEQLDRKDRQLDALNLHISIKDKQIKALHKQIEELNKALVISQEQTKAAQTLHAADIHREIVEKLIASQEEPKKRGFGRKKSKSNTPQAEL